MQKKQLRTVAIIALIAIFVVGNLLRINLEPADLDSYYNGENQVAQSTTETDDVGTTDDTNDDVNNEVSGGDDSSTAVSDDENSAANGDDGKINGKDNQQADVKDEKKPNDLKNEPGQSGDSGTGDKNADQTDKNTAADDNGGSTADNKTDSSSTSGKKSNYYPPIPEVAVADPANPRTFQCTMEIYCTTLLNEENIDNEAIIPYIPSDGVILAKTTIDFVEGENAFDVILRATRANNIQFEFREDALYSGAYVEGINYIYEQDGGPLSGWMYKVNGQFPNYGCKRYIVQDGDEIVWMYTCDLGRDVGDNSIW